MKAELGQKDDITGWMELVCSVRWNFPGLEADSALEEHRKTVLRFMQKQQALCVKQGAAVIGVLLFSVKRNMICCLAVSPDFRRQGIASCLLSAALERLDRSRDITVSTFREEDPWGTAPRALYRKFGFEEGALLEEYGHPAQILVLPAKDASRRNLLEAIHSTNDHEREIFGAVRKPFNEHLGRWHSEARPDQANNNFFFPTGPLTGEDMEDAMDLQKSRGLDYLLLRTVQPLSEALRQEFQLEEDVLYVMALTRDTSAGWKENPEIEIRDIQTHDISADLLDVSGVPEPYRDIARRNMELVLEVAETHPEYHWYCAYQNGVHAANIYALCHNGCVEMDDLWVEEAYRNRYIATTLMKHIAQTLDGMMYLHADASRTPKDMYAKMGFEIVETVYEYYREI